MRATMVSGPLSARLRRIVGTWLVLAACLFVALPASAQERPWWDPEGVGEAFRRAFGGGGAPMPPGPVMPGPVGAPTFDEPFGAGQSTINGLVNAIFQFGILLCIIAATIYISVGAFYYFVATGNAELAGRGKQIIQRSIIGLLLALISWVLLNTISTQFTNLRQPEFGAIGGGGAPGGGAPAR